MIGAEQAEKDGLVSRVVPAAELMDSTMETAKKIASFSLPIAAMCKEAVNGSYDLGLNEVDSSFPPPQIVVNSS
jgi:enoyl-CoA hydratase